MKKEKLVEILLALEEQAYDLMQEDEARKDDIARAQHYAVMTAYSKAIKIICCDWYAESIAKEVGVEL